MLYYSELNNYDINDDFYELYYNNDDIEEFFDYIHNHNVTRIWIVMFWNDVRDPDDITEKDLVNEYSLEEIDDYQFRLDIKLILYEIPQEELI